MEGQSVNIVLKQIQNKETAYDQQITCDFLQKMREKEQFISQLDNHQYLENYILEYFSESDYALLDSAICLFNYKFRHSIDPYKYIEDIKCEETFEVLFGYIVSGEEKRLDVCGQKVTFVRNHLLLLEKPYVSRLVLKLVGPPLMLWSDKMYLRRMLTESEERLSEYMRVKQMTWLKESGETSYLPQLLDRMYEQLQVREGNIYSQEQIVWFYAVLQLVMTGLQMMSARIYIKGLLFNRQLLEILRHSVLLEQETGIKHFVDWICFYSEFPVNSDGEEMTKCQQQLQKSDMYRQVQSILYSEHGLQMTFQQISKYAFENMLEEKEKDIPDLLQRLYVCEMGEWEEVCKIVKSGMSKYDMQMECLKTTIGGHEEMIKRPLIPTEKDIWDTDVLNTDDDRVCLPVLNLQFLCLSDYLIRNSYLLKVESTYQVKQDIESCLERMHVRYGEEQIGFEGWSRMGVRVDSFVIHNVGEPRLGETAPREVLAEVTYDHSQMQTYIHKEWDDLQQGDIVYLISFGREGVEYMRGGQVVEQLDDKQRTPDRDRVTGTKRRLHLLMDVDQYKTDVESERTTTVYGRFKLMIRRKRKENVYKAILANITSLIHTPPSLSSILTDLVIGYAHQSLMLKDQIHSGGEEEEREKEKEKEEDKEREKEREKGDKKKRMRFTQEQRMGIKRGEREGITLVEGPPGTGKTDVVVEMIRRLSKDKENKIVVVTQNNSALNDLFVKIEQESEIDSRYLLRLGQMNKRTKNDYSKQGRLVYLEKLRVELIQNVYRLQMSIDSQYSSDYTIQTAMIFYQFQIMPRVASYRSTGVFPFSAYSEQIGLNEEETIEDIESTFRGLEEMKYLEIIRNRGQKESFLLTQYSRIIFMTGTHAAMKHTYYRESGLSFSTLIFEESAQILDIQTYLAMTLQKTDNLKRLIMLGDRSQLPPVVKHQVTRAFGMNQSMFTRLLRLGLPVYQLTQQARCRDSLLSLFKGHYRGLTSMDQVGEERRFERANRGLRHTSQFINCNGQQQQPTAVFYQNVEEAEYTVAMYMYMVCMGVEPSQITILTFYNGQKYLIRDIIHQKCQWNTAFGRPSKVTTVDQYQGQQNDYVLLSMVRTQGLGFLRDPRRILVAFSRARYGLYVFGSFNNFVHFPEHKGLFARLREKGLQLQIMENEGKERERLEDDEVGVEEVRSVQDYKELYETVKQIIQRSL